MKRTLVAFLALIPFAAAAAPTPVLSGLYSVGELGLVYFSVVDGKVVGKAKASGVCEFPLDTPVVTGLFEGGVFIGNVTLCQTGAGCPNQHTYPMLGVFHDDSVAGWIRIDSKCQTRALDRSQLFFRPATNEEQQKVSTDSSAAAIAQKGSAKDPSMLAVEAITDGQRLIQDTKFTQAREKFRQAMELDDVHWEAALGYGLTEVKLSHPERSLEFFDRALALAQNHKASAGAVAQIHYNRACAQVAMGDKKGALASLKTAVRVGGPSNLIDQLTDDPDLGPLRSDAEFKRFLADAQAQHNRKKQK